ncbi:hypothetical protein J1N35_043095 [Gossypium stocksii]|uniref:Uncharacterized protein n=1 Tax=Gossypium stocksii TaxID=47602 RepID=A0A9D3ZES9_9ROSI|nr:hypothetical protein J1N35_043095 [Gossypium stocksii]
MNCQKFGVEVFIKGGLLCIMQPHHHLVEKPDIVEEVDLVCHLQPWKLYVVAFSLDDCCNYNPSSWKLYAVAFSLDDCCNYNPSVI